MRKALIEKHPLWIRWTHWINFPLLFLMIWSGILIYWANPVYSPFFPKWFYNTFHVDHRLAEGMALHFTFMWLFAVNGVLYCAYLLISGYWRELFPRKKSLREALEVTLHDLHLRDELPPQGTYNAAQRIAYTGVLIMAIFSLLTGLVIYKPVQFWRLSLLFGGYEGARLVHFILAMAYIAFFVIHILQVIRAGGQNFRSMVAGIEVKSR
jgi:thiosulfate reductase cytochrome b subunit